MIRQEGTEWLLYNKDGSRILGRHKSKEDAMAQERAIHINKRAEMLNDINTRAHEKMAALKDLVDPALIGAGALTGFATVPAILNAYANDKEVGKTVAGVAQYTMPLGALAGAGFGGGKMALKGMGEIAANTLKKIVESMPDTAALKDILKSISDNAAPHLKDVKDRGLRFIDSGSELLQVGKDTLNSVSGAAKRLAGDAEDAVITFSNETGDTIGAGARAVEDFLKGR